MQRKSKFTAWSYRLGMVALLSAVVSGCNPSNDSPIQNSSVKSIDPQNTATRIIDQNDDELDEGSRPVEDRDQLMGRNLNPNLNIGHQDIMNAQQDTQQMRALAKVVQGVEGARATITGGHAYVTLDLIHNVTGQDARRIERDVMNVLQKKYPRYEIHITSDDGNFGNMNNRNAGNNQGIFNRNR
ncbi:YhcN/YlaJ family sporulation lipoprotein [Brevibacillus dissolubilis]|uniref:YhcN/YlaJ family sporulation lipoprotein n=1 Tax=Brevibacillus dissolubilis TaxID=1844116 RepID=UPI00159B9471|nr:YhcN/YlaJ family sporulation lipoprotein [Brevibacillus dissolubilis]